MLSVRYERLGDFASDAARVSVRYPHRTASPAHLSGLGTNLIGSDPNATTNVLSNTSFRATGAIKQLDYGNGLRLEMGYSAERQQPTSMKVAPISNPNAPVLSYGYDYDYYDANSQNNNRIRKITDYLNGLDNALPPACRLGGRIVWVSFSAVSFYV